MNITGYGQYSKEVSGLRNPNKILNQQLKLIFIYPILAADKIKIQSAPPFDQLIRDFISVTFLSDMFVQNTFSVISTANQIRPLWDESNQPFDPLTGIARTYAALQGIASTGGASLPNYPVGSEAAPRVEQKIQQKTAVIQQLLKVDPKFAKLRPHMEMITMGNMIDVPVVVGTAYYPVDTLTLMWTLIAAIGLNRSLSKQSDLDVIFRELENMNEKKYWKLLNNLIRSPEDQTYLGSYFQRGLLATYRTVGSWNKALPNLSAMAHNQALKLQKKISEQPDFQTQQRFLPLYLNKKDLDQTKLYFQFVIDPDFAKRRFGIDVGNESTRSSDVTVTKLQKSLSSIESWILSSFQNSISTVGSILINSFGNIISASSTNLDITKLKESTIDRQLIENIKPNLNEMISSVSESISGRSIDESREGISKLKDLCEIDSKKVVEQVAQGVIKFNISSRHYDNDDLTMFMTRFKQMASIASAKSVEIERSLDYILSDENRNSFNAHRQEIYIKLNKLIDDFTKPFIDELSSQGAQQHLYDTGIVLMRIIPNMSDSLAKIFYFFFLAQFQEALCRFILVADVELETASNEVTEWPNYTLILPVEIVIALHAAIMGKSWQHLLSGGMLGQNLRADSRPPDRMQVVKSSLVDVNDTYVKSIIKYISGRLNVPNLIVVDSRRNEIYYKLMNQTDVNKTKISTISTFIDSKLNRTLTTQQYY